MSLPSQPTAVHELGSVLERLRPRLGDPDGVPQPLEGGITNRNYRVRLGGTDYILRLPGRDTELLGIDREAERAATAAAAEIGLGAEYVAFLPDERCLVTRFIDGRPARADELRSARLPQVARALRAVHAGPPLPVSFSPFRIVEDYRALALARGAAIPAEHELACQVAREVEPLMRGPEHDPVPCHNDLLPANFLLERERVRIIDWEYAGMGDRYFDLANLSVNNGFDEADDARLVAEYFGEPSARRLPRLRLMRLMSDFREAMWGVLQSVVSTLDFDFGAYAQQHFERLAAAAAQPRYRTWLEDARAEAA